jgi:outer membrane protein
MGLTFSIASHADNLLSLYQRALLASPELSGSQYALDIARAQEDQSFGKLLPQAAIKGNYSGNQLKRETFKANGYPGTSASINMRQPLFDLQAYLLMKSQQSLTAKGEETLLAAHQQLISDLVERYVDALEAADKSEIIRAELSSTEKQLDRVKAMNDRQMALVTDLFELQARVETLRTSLIESNNDANIALEKLRELTGDAVTDIQPVRLDSTLPPPDGNVDSWIHQANSINPDLNALKHAVESADQSIDAYQAGHLPRVELQASGNYSNTTYNNQQSPPYEVGTVGVEATIPIYEGGITSARVREAEGRKGLSSSQLEQKLREIEKVTRATYLDMASSPARNQATDRQLDASEKAKRAMEKGYELGVVTIVDLLNAQKQLSESHKVQHQARYRYFKARTSLLQQAGRLDVEELAKLNDWLIAENPLVESDKPAMNAVVSPVVKPTVNAAAKPVSKPAVNAVVNPVVKPVVNAVTEPVTKPAVSAVANPVVKPAVNAMAEPAVNPSVVEPAVNPPVNAVTEPLIKPPVNVIAESEIKLAVARPKVNSDDCSSVHTDYRNPKYKHCLTFTPSAKP